MASVRWKKDGMTQQPPAAPSLAPAPATAQSSPKQAHMPHGWIHRPRGYHQDYVLLQLNFNTPLHRRLHHTLKTLQEPPNTARGSMTTQWTSPAPPRQSHHGRLFMQSSVIVACPETTAKQPGVYSMASFPAVHFCCTYIPTQTQMQHQHARMWSAVEPQQI